MATTYKVLGQSAPSANTDTNVYTVPAGTQAIISTIAVCNLTQGELLYRIAVRPNGASIANEHYIAYDAKAAGNDTTFITVGITADAGDVITVRSSSTGNIAFNVYGSEIN